MQLRRHEDTQISVQQTWSPGSPGESLSIESAHDARVPALECALLLTHCLARENAAAGVWNALALHAAGVMRGWKAICILMDGTGTPGLPIQTPVLDEPLARGVVRECTAPSDDWGGDFAATLLERGSAVHDMKGLHGLFEDSSVQRVACMTVGKRGLLAIIERRAERVFLPDDWYRLRAIALHADSTLERISLASRNRQAP